MKKMINSILLSLLIVSSIGVIRESNDFGLASTSQVVLENDIFKQPSEESNIEKSYICWPWQNCYEQQYSSDSYEDNNKFNDAYNLGTFSPTRTNYNYGTIHDVSETDKDVDYYKFTTKAKKTVSLKLYNIPSGTDYDLKLYTYSNGFLGIGSSSTQIASSTKGGNSSEEIIVVLEAGEYFIKVYSFSGMSSSKYTLSTRVTDNNTVFYDQKGMVIWTRDDEYSEAACNISLLYTSCSTTDTVIYISNEMIQYFDEIQETYGNAALNAAVSNYINNPTATYATSIGVGLVGWAFMSNPAGFAFGTLVGGLVWSLQLAEQMQIEHMQEVFQQAKDQGKGIRIENWTYTDGQMYAKSSTYSVWSGSYVYTRYSGEEYGTVEVMNESEIRAALGYN
jgi:hypothetical protein